MKSHKLNVEDIKRGIFQCTQYRAVLVALLLLGNQREEGKVIFALGGALFSALSRLKNVLGVELVDNFAPSVAHKKSRKAWPEGGL